MELTISKFEWRIFEMEGGGNSRQFKRFQLTTENVV